VTPLLEAEGHRVFTPTLTGLGQETTENLAEIGLDMHVSDVMTIIVGHDLNDIVLVGHSYGGMVITGVADRMKDRIGHIVYVDAAVPEGDQSMISYGPPIDAAALAEKTRLTKLLSSDGVTFGVLPPEAFGIPDAHPRHGWAKARMKPHPMKTWLDPLVLRNGGPEGIERTYIHCIAPILEQTNFPYVAEKARSSRSWNYAELQTGHDAMITAPQELADLLLAAA
jgi:pimeloyl-ACP methyl ester carboxylesterase